MAKCDLCREKIQTTFLSKILGTYVKTTEGKKKVICFACQRKFEDKGQILEALA